MFVKDPSEKMRLKLLKEELKLRNKQPEHWATTKYRKYAKPFTEEELEKIKELDQKRSGKHAAVALAQKKPKGKAIKPKKKGAKKKK